MMNKNSQMGHGIIYLLSTGAEFLILLLSLPFFLAVLSPSDYGVMALAQIYAFIVVGLANFGMTQSYERNFFQYQKDPLDVAKLFYSCVSFAGVNLLIIGGITFYCQDPIAQIMQIKGWGHLLVLVFFAEAAKSLLQYYMINLRNNERPVEYMIWNVGVNIVSVSLSLLFVLYMNWGALGFVLGKFIANTVLLLLSQVRLMRSLKFALDKVIFMAAFKFSLPMTPRTILGVCSNQLDKYMLGLLASLDGVGLYTIAQKIAYGIFAFMVSVQNVFVPRAYKMMFNDGSKAGVNVGAYITPFAYICIGVAMLVALFSEEFVRLFTPNRYHGIFEIIIVFAMYYGIQFIGRISGIQLMYSKRTILVTVLSVVTLLANVAISIPFIIKWGAIGAAWGALSAGVISVILSFYLGQKSFRIYWEQDRIIAIFALFLAASILQLIMGACGVGYELRLLTKVIAVVMYFSLGVRCGWVNRNLLTLIRPSGA